MTISNHVWFAPEWLARFAPSGIPDNEDQAPRAYDLTVKDMVLVLAIVGQWSSIDVSDRDENTAMEALAIMDRAQGPYANGLPTMRLDVRELRRFLGLARTTDVTYSMGRVVNAANRGNPVFRFIEPVDYDGAPWRTLYDYSFSPKVLSAHPVNSGIRQSVAVDLGAVGSFACSQSVPIAMRALSWLGSRNRVGLGRILNSFEQQQGKRPKLLNVENAGAGLTIEMPVHLVASTLGLAQIRVFTPQSIETDRIVADLAKAGIAVDFEWRPTGRRLTHLAMRMSRMKVESSPKKVNLGSRAWMNTWTTTRNVKDRHRELEDQP